MAIMGTCNHFISALLGGMALTLLVHAQDQSDFISIDCGTPANSSYTEPFIGINYISDATFIDTGISKSISTELNAISYQQEWTLRSFPDGIRNCYRINITQGVKYLIRATFLHGNYDGQDNNLPEFDLHLGPNMWDTVKIENASSTVSKELIHVPTLNYIHVCLVNTNLGTPFISAIELRPLNNNAYVTASGSLALYVRTDDGSLTDTEYRYGDDIYDRIWEPDDTYKGINTSLPIDSQSRSDYQPPSVVMSTAATPETDSSPLNFNWDSETATSEYYIYMHFAEVVKLKANQSRSFNVTINGEPFFGPYVPVYLYTETWYRKSPLTMAENYEASIFKTENSTLPPILNAVEIYSVKNLSQSETDQQDVDAITKIKSTYGVKKNWQGDPCVPQLYLWEGLNCSYDGYNSLELFPCKNLSSSGLIGEISADISNLVMLQDLNLEGNQLNGSIPAELIKRSKSGSLLLSVGENSNLCASDPCEREKKKNIVVLILASVVGLLILSLTIAAILCGITRRKQQQDKTTVALVDTEPNVQNRPLESMQRQVTYSDLQRITNNFERILGKGGFGTVYYGCIDGIHVAVKVKLLMRVHHKNLTTLVGYYKSNRLNEKSDVYSFGVVLLKVITNRPVIERSLERIHISQWVGFMLAKGDIQNIVDPRLGGDLNVNSVWKAVEVAVACVSPTSSRRPTMSQVVAELKESLTTELSQKIEGYRVELKDSFEMINMDLSTELNPLAR
ncbi:putative leucine-rich repeat receptor-like protein kinase [Quercus suber]|uniref:Leucine-rich repeat receptor-like protein kinase n=1 Tax=Quercus suber TaxID=58331 RepID=A0AAW0KVB8_QUESU